MEMDISVQAQQYLSIFDVYLDMAPLCFTGNEKNHEYIQLPMQKLSKQLINHQIFIIKSLNKLISIKYIKHIDHFKFILCRKYRI